MSFLAVDGVPVNVLVGTTELEQLQKTAGLKGQFAEFKIKEETVRAWLKPEIDALNCKAEESEDDVFTTEKTCADQGTYHGECTNDESVVVSLEKENDGVSNQEGTKVCHSFREF